MDAQLLSHPNDAQLSAYGLGKLDDDSADAVNRHLEACADCRNRVASLSEDSFLGRVRQAHGLSATPAPEKALSGLGQNTQPAPSPAAGLNVPPELAAHPDYEIVRELGQGGMGVVYLARNRLMDRPEVLKVMNKALLAKPGAAERFQQEIRLAAQLRHPNVVAAHSVLRLGDLLVLTMEYVNGQDLAQLVQDRGPLPVLHACYYAQQAALGLQHAFEKGLVHRDIKPSNLMLAKDGKKHTIKVLDFGLAKLADDPAEARRLTASGQMMGTPDYVAPEQIQNAQQVDIRADIYSLGCTLYYLLAGEAPFQGGSVYQVLSGHVAAEAKSLHEVRPEVPAGLAAVVAKMMAKEPAQRYQRPAEVARALAPFVKPGQASAQGKSSTQQSGAPSQQAWESLTGVSQVGTSATQTQTVTAPRVVIRRRRRPWLWPGVVAGVLLAGVIGLWAGGVIKVKTRDGVIVLEVDEPNAEVFVDGERITVTWADGGKKAEVRAKPGTRKVEARINGVTTVGEEVSVQEGRRTPLRITFQKPAEQAGPVPVANPPAAQKSVLAPEKAEWAGKIDVEHETGRLTGAVALTITKRQGDTFEAYLRGAVTKLMVEGVIDESGQVKLHVSKVIAGATIPLEDVTGVGEVTNSRMTLRLEKPNGTLTARYELKRISDEALANFNFQGRWKCHHVPSGWSGFRTVTGDTTFTDFDGKPGTWSRDGGLLQLHFSNGGYEGVAIDPDNPNELKGGGGQQSSTWVRQ